MDVNFDEQIVKELREIFDEFNFYFGFRVDEYNLDQDKLEVLNKYDINIYTVDEAYSKKKPNIPCIIVEIDSKDNLVLENKTKLLDINVYFEIYTKTTKDGTYKEQNTKIFEIINDYIHKYNMKMTDRSRLIPMGVDSNVRMQSVIYKGVMDDNGYIYQN